MKKTQSNFGVWCEVTAGITGWRCTWLKDGRKIKSFSSLEKADIVAKEMTANISSHNTIHFSYTAKEF